MKIALLASNPKLYSNQRLIEAAKNNNHDIDFINIGKCYLEVSNQGSKIFYGNKLLPKYDIVLTRIKPALTAYATAIIRQFEAMGTITINKSSAIIKSRDKLHCLQLLAKNNIPIPTTSFANSAYDTQHLIELVNKAPLIIKLLEGTKGVGVMLAETDNAANSIINAFRSIKANILVQNYIQESYGKDIRCFVVGDKVVASIEREAQGNEFRANIHLGAKARKVTISKEEEEMAIIASKIVGLDIAGVDIVRSKNGSKIIEINSSPGLEGIENATSIDIADLIFNNISTLK